MDINKLNKWADLLLDTGKRNNLINFKDTKMGTVEVVSPNFDNLFLKVGHSTNFEVYDPKLNDDEDEEFVDDTQQENDIKEYRISKEDYISEEWLLKRIAHFFKREKVTSVVREEFNERMDGCETIGIIRKNGFIYLQNKEIPMLRIPQENASVIREIKYIALEELALGMKEILKQNISVEKSGLFRLLVQQLGFSRIGDSNTNRFEDALSLISNDIEINGNMLSLKNK